MVVQLISERMCSEFPESLIMKVFDAQSIFNEKVEKFYDWFSDEMLKCSRLDNDNMFQF